MEMNKECNHFPMGQVLVIVYPLCPVMRSLQYFDPQREIGVIPSQEGRRK